MCTRMVRKRCAGRPSDPGTYRQEVEKADRKRMDADLNAPARLAGREQRVLRGVQFPLAREHHKKLNLA